MLSMYWLIILGLVVLAVTAATAIKKKGKSTDVKNGHRYTSKTPLTKNEQIMYWRLIDALPGYVVLAQVELSRCISANGAALSTIKGKSLDFVICNTALEVIAGIEIDDKSHSSPAAKKRDAAKNDAMKIAGIKLIRWPATPLPSFEQIRRQFPSMAENTTELKNFEPTQERRIKILELQLFNVTQKLKQASSNSALTFVTKDMAATPK